MATRLVEELERAYPIELLYPFEGSDRVGGAVWVARDLLGNESTTSVAKLRWDSRATDLPMHVHDLSDRFIIVVKGRGFFHVSDESAEEFTGKSVRSIPARERDVFLFRRGTVHTFSTDAEPMTLLSCQLPFLPFDDPRQYRLPKVRWTAKEFRDSYAAGIACDPAWSVLAEGPAGVASRFHGGSCRWRRMYFVLRFILILTVLLFATVAALVVELYPGLVLVVVVGLIWRAGTSRRGSTAHGTARWAQLSDLSHMLEGDGLILGRIDGRTSRMWGLRSLLSPRLPSRSACQRFLSSEHIVRLAGTVHTAIFAPTGVGKGVSCVIPHLLTCSDSMVVVDFKGENCTLTARARRAIGHRVVVLDPYQITTREPDTFNPLERLDKDSATVLDDCRDLAAALVIRNPDEREPHWADSAEVWLTAMIAFVVAYAKGADKSLQSVREAAEAAKSIGGQIWDGVKPMFDHGRTELAAAIFSGHAHVMYMKGNDGVEQEQKQEQAHEHAKDAPERQNEGREM